MRADLSVAAGTRPTKPNADKVGACALPPSALAAPRVRGCPLRVSLTSEPTPSVPRYRYPDSEHRSQVPIVLRVTTHYAPAMTAD